MQDNEKKPKKPTLHDQTLRYPYFVSCSDIRKHVSNEIISEECLVAWQTHDPDGCLRNSS